MTARVLKLGKAPAGGLEESSRKGSLNASLDPEETPKDANDENDQKAC